MARSNASTRRAPAASVKLAAEAVVASYIHSISARHGEEQSELKPPERDDRS